jgi:hypothetical protein
MKYLRILIVVLTLTLIGIGVYYLFLRFNFSIRNTVFQTKSKESFESPIPFTYQKTLSVQEGGNKSVDYLSANFIKNLDDSLVISGRFQAADSVEKTLDGVNYRCIVGIVKDGDKDLSRIWLTEDECNQIYEDIFVNIKRDWPVSVTLTKQGVQISVKSSV